ARAPAVTTNSNELDNLLRSIIVYFLAGNIIHARGAPPPRVAQGCPRSLMPLPAALQGALRAGLAAGAVHLSERVDDLFRVRAHRLQPRPLGDDDAPQPIDGGGQLVVDDDEVVLDEGGDLLFGDLQPPLHLFLAVLAAAAQSALEHL